VLSELGHHGAAEREASTARATLCRLGATRKADCAELGLAQDEGEGEAKRQVLSGGLTRREREILCLVAQGQSNDVIAANLILSVRTVERHLSNIYDKAGVSGKSARIAAVAYGRRQGWV
jgi:DNA-binding NarL/FixJ family response regulator